MITLTIIVLLIIIAIKLNNPQNLIYKNNKIDKNDITNYTSKKYVMTKTELQFFRELKKITDEIDLLIFPQVQLEKIIQVKDNNFSQRNRIKSRTIDFTIVNNHNCKIIACIELDDYTHNRIKSIKNDEFKNKLFNQVNIPLIRIKVNNYYKLDKLKEYLKQKKESNI